MTAILPVMLTPTDSEAERRRYAIVRLDTMELVAPDSLILSASVESGMALVRHPDGNSQEYKCGAGGLRIILRGR